MTKYYILCEIPQGDKFYINKFLETDVAEIETLGECYGYLFDNKEDAEYTLKLYTKKFDPYWGNEYSVESIEWGD